MSNQHAKSTVIFAATAPPASGGTDISLYCNTSEFGRTAEAHDLTTYGKNSKVYGGGLKDGTFTLGGPYSTTSSGTPRTLFQDREGTTFYILRRVEGTGSTKPQAVFSAVLTKYNEVSPVDDYVMWSAEFQCSDDVTHTTQ